MHWKMEKNKNEYQHNCLLIVIFSIYSNLFKKSNSERGYNVMVSGNATLRNDNTILT